MVYLPLHNIEMAQRVEIFPEGRHRLIQYSQYNCCWWPGDTQSQGISSEGIDLVVLNNLDSVVKWLIICILNHIMFTYVSLPQVSEWMI